MVVYCKPSRKGKQRILPRVKEIGQYSDLWWILRTWSWRDQRAFFLFTQAQP